MSRSVAPISPRYHEAAERVWGDFTVDQLPPLLSAFRRLSDNADHLGERPAIQRSANRKPTRTDPS